MEAVAMSWNLTMLVVHVLAAVVFALLFKKTPDTLQQILIGLIIASATVMVYAYAYALRGMPHGEVESFRWIAQEIEHVAVLFYGFRLFYMECLCRNYSRPSPSSRP